MKIDLTPLKIVVLLNGNYYSKPDRYYPLNMEGVVLHIVLRTDYARDLMNRGKLIELLCNPDMEPTEASIKVRWANDSRVMIEAGSLIFRRGLISIINPLWDSEEFSHIEMDHRPEEELISNTGGKQVIKKRNFKYYDPRFNKPEQVPLDNRWHPYMKNGLKCEALRTGAHTIKLRECSKGQLAELSYAGPALIDQDEVVYAEMPEPQIGRAIGEIRRELEIPLTRQEEVIGQEISRASRHYSKKASAKLVDLVSNYIIEPKTANTFISVSSRTGRSSSKYTNEPVTYKHNWATGAYDNSISQKQAEGLISIDIESLPVSWSTLDGYSDLRPTERPQKLDGTISEVSVDTGVAINTTDIGITTGVANTTDIGTTKDVSTNDNNTKPQAFDDSEHDYEDEWWAEDLEDDPDW